MESKHACKICGRKFANGKSMGGHMRSHFVNLPVQPKPASPRPDSARVFLNLDSGTARGSQIHFASSVNQFSAAMDLSVRASAKKRSNRARPRLKSMQSAQLNAPLLNPKYGNFSSPDELVTVEDVALCLMMLSNCKWSEGVCHPDVTILSDSYDTLKEIDALGADEDDKDDDYDDSSESMDLNIFGYKCETCNKVFKSYQALGGHMRSHQRSVTQPALAIEKKEFPCKICSKVFSSGQALGGHMKVHLSTAKKSTARYPLPKHNLPMIRVDSESDSDFKFSSSTFGTGETSSDTDSYYNAKR